MLSILYAKAAKRVKSQEIPGLQPCPRSRLRLGSGGIAEKTLDTDSHDLDSWKKPNLLTVKEATVHLSSGNVSQGLSRQLRNFGKEELRKWWKKCKAIRECPYTRQNVGIHISAVCLTILLKQFKGFFHV